MLEARAYTCTARHPPVDTLRTKQAFSLSLFFCLIGDFYYFVLRIVMFFFLIFYLSMYRFVFVSLLGEVPRGLRNEAEMDCVLSARAVGADLKFDRHVGNPTRSHSTNDGRYSI